MLCRILSLCSSILLVSMVPVASLQKVCICISKQFISVKENCTWDPKTSAHASEKQEIHIISTEEWGSEKCWESIKFLFIVKVCKRLEGVESEFAVNLFLCFLLLYEICIIILVSYNSPFLLLYEICASRIPW